MSYLDDMYAKELRKLKQRVAYRRKQGYDIDINKILAPTGQDKKRDLEYIKSIRGQKIREFENVDYESYSEEDFSGFMNPYIGDNEEDFSVPDDRYDPNVYSTIEQIGILINQFPNALTIQFDEGELVRGKYGQRDTISTEFIGNILYDIYDKTVHKAMSEGRTQELEDYYKSIEHELGEKLEPYFSDIPYYYESELIKDFTEMLRLLNWGEALSQSEMENLSEVYDLTDVELHDWGEEMY